MAHSSGLPYDSDASYSPGDDSDSDASCHQKHEAITDADESDIGSFGPEDEYECAASDIEDQAQLFGGNVHSAEYYKKAVEEFNECDWDTQDYSNGSLLLLDAFCEILELDVQDCYRSVSESRSLRLLYNFFDWSLNQKIGKDGRKRRGIKKSSSLGTYWKVFRLVFERATGDKLDSKMNRRMHKVLRHLSKKHNLSDQKRANRAMTIEDLKEQIETIISTTKKSFGLGELRVLAVLFLLLLAPAGARPTSILRLRFGDIRLVLARDPEGGPHNILIRFTLAFTKTYLGVKDAKTFPIPETLYDPSLLLNPHVFLLGILFRHKAFRAASLTSPAQLAKLDIHPGELELPLPLRDDIKETYIFRRAVKTFTGVKLSSNEPISYQMMAQWIKRIGEILGLEYSTIPYNLRYNAANEFDRSADISESLRNLALDHANSNPFQRHYLGREVCADTWAVLRRQEPQQALVRQACSVGHSKSKRRPIDLTSEQAASVNTDPFVKRLQRELRQYRQGSKKYLEIRRQLKNAKQTLKRKLKHKIREEWTTKQAVDDIEQQLQGIGFAKNPTVKGSLCSQRPAQGKLLEAINAPLGRDLNDQYRRRDNAINAIITYCMVEEGLTIRRPQTLLEPADRKHHDDPSLGRPIYDALLSVFVKAKKDRPRRCFICVGKAQTLSPDDGTVADLLREFYTPGDVSKHFRRKHLANLHGDECIKCPACDLSLDHSEHLRNHALRVHGIVS
ncbi:hypothetical protein HIM_08398 [Hirsutella minnesotensis 3608]|uniref:C2H2-type domain-containing protein n=1 Tax=Hirsutella minnesotensis 3608 TaxID=1043627 RepID=A0A0F7ZH96_9HYPO|nr:hypothetical protein HIM_08398 [Hirsutella minnesotensis 3608]